MYRRDDPDFLAKAVLVAEPARIQGDARNTPVFPYLEPFSPEILDPFFDKLKQAGLNQSGLNQSELDQSRSADAGS